MISFCNYSCQQCACPGKFSIGPVTVAVGVVVLFGLFHWVLVAVWSCGFFFLAGAATVVEIVVALVAASSPNAQYPDCLQCLNFGTSSNSCVYSCNSLVCSTRRDGFSPDSTSAEIRPSPTNFRKPLFQTSHDRCWCLVLRPSTFAESHCDRIPEVRPRPARRGSASHTKLHQSELGYISRMPYGLC